MKHLARHRFPLLLKSAGLAVVGASLALLAAPLPAVAAPAPDPAALRAGKQVFSQICFACHQANGQGMAGVFPPLARSDFLLGHHDHAIAVLLHGRQGAITVNGQRFNNVMPQLNLSDRQIADVLTYVLNSWGNADGAVTVADVTQVREDVAAR